MTRVQIATERVQWDSSGNVFYFMLSIKIIHIKGFQHTPENSDSSLLRNDSS